MATAFHKEEAVMASTLHKDEEESSANYLRGLFSQVQPATDDKRLKQLEEKIREFLYTKYLIDANDARLVDEKCFFGDPPSMETQYYYIYVCDVDDSEDSSANGDDCEDSAANDDDCKCGTANNDDAADDDSDSSEEDCMDGMWMLFFPNNILDEMWMRARLLYRNSQFPGIECMCVSTARPNPRASDDTVGVILMYCGPHDDTDLMRTTGHNIALLMSYYNIYGYMYYKPCAMAETGTRATGQRVNSLYRIPVPRTIVGVLEKKSRLQHVINDPYMYQKWLERQVLITRNESGYYGVRI